MAEKINIEERKSIWMALSEFYLDTELEEKFFRYFALEIIESPYTLDEVKRINKYEVFPVLQPNLMSVAGEWAGFNEEWLVKSIVDALEKRNKLKKWGIEICYLTFKWMCKDYWEETERLYKQIKTNPNLILKKSGTV